MRPDLRTELARVTWDLTRAVLPEYTSDARYPWFALDFDALDPALRARLEDEAERNGTAADVAGLTAYLKSLAADPSQLAPTERDEFRRGMLGAFARIDQLQATLASQEGR